MLPSSGDMQGENLDVCAWVERGMRVVPDGASLTTNPHSLDYLSRFFGGETAARSLLSRLGITPDPSARYSEETLQAMRRLRDQPPVAVPPPSIWLSLEAAGKQLSLEPSKVYSLAARGALVGDLSPNWLESRVERSSVLRYAAAPAEKPVEPSPMPQVKPEPVELPPAPVLDLLEPERPFGSLRRAADAVAKGIKGVIHA